MDYFLLAMSVMYAVLALISMRTDTDATRAALLLFAIFIVGFSVVEEIQNLTIEVTTTPAHVSSDCGQIT